MLLLVQLHTYIQTYIHTYIYIYIRIHLCDVYIRIHVRLLETDKTEVQKVRKSVQALFMCYIYGLGCFRCP